MLGRHLFLLVLAVTSAVAQKPQIDKVDPPNWFAALPDPMLLLHGSGLKDAHYRVQGKEVRVLRSRSSDNGHWAVVWLGTQGARPGKLRVDVRSAEGAASFDYLLKPRRSSAEQPSGFSPSDVVYLIMPDRFAEGDTQNAAHAMANRSLPHAYHGGDLEGIRRHLDYIQKLGVTAVWLTPVVQNSARGADYHGYGATDLYAVDSRLGSLADYRRLADTLHRRGMKLIFDDVPNHVGPDHPWVTDPPQPDWFHGTAARHRDNRYLFPPVTDPHAAPNMSDEALDGWFANILPDMNQGNPEVATYFTQNMIWWIEEVGLDGLRIDTFPYVPRAFWLSYLGELSRLYPRLAEVGEVEDGDPTIVSYFAGGRELAGVDTHLTTPFDYPMYYKLLDVLTKGQPMSALENTFRQDWLYPHPELLMPFLGNHDQPRFLSLPGSSPALLRLGFGLVLTMRGTPQLYAGDEVLMEGGGDPDNRRDFPGGFPGDRADAFAAEHRSPEQRRMYDWVAGLGEFRARTPALQSGAQQTVFADANGFAFVRNLGTSASACSSIQEKSVLVVANRDIAERTLDIPVRRSVLAGCHGAEPAFGDTAPGVQPSFSEERLRVSLPAFGFAVYALR